MYGSDELREIFEQLFLLRRCYPLRSPYDTQPTVSIDQAVEYGERLMRLATIRDRRTGRWRDPAQPLA